MSVLSRDRASEAGDPGALRQLAVVIVPVAKRAGMTARDGARSAATWAAPHVNVARTWTAPRIEGSGLAIRDTVGPRIYEVLVATARRVEVTPADADAAAARRRWPAATAGMVLLAAAGAAMAAVIQRRKAAVASGAPQDAVAGASQAAPDGQAGARRPGRRGRPGLARRTAGRPRPDRNLACGGVTRGHDRAADVGAWCTPSARGRAAATGQALRPVSHAANFFVPPEVPRFTGTGD